MILQKGSPGPVVKPELPPKKMLKRSSGLSSPSNVLLPNALAKNPDEGPEEDIPLNLDSGSPRLRSGVGERREDECKKDDASFVFANKADNKRGLST